MNSSDALVKIRIQAKGSLWNAPYFIFLTMHTPEINLHVQYHTWKVTHLRTRDPSPIRWNTICTFQAFYLPARGRRGVFTAQVWGYLRQHHLQPLCWLRTPSLSPLHTLCFFTCHLTPKSKPFSKRSWPQHHDTPLQGVQTSPCQKDCGKQGGLHSQMLIQNSLCRHSHLERQCSSNTDIAEPRIINYIARLIMIISTCMTHLRGLSWTLGSFQVSHSSKMRTCDPKVNLHAILSPSPLATPYHWKIENWGQEMG